MSSQKHKIIVFNDAGVRYSHDDASDYHWPEFKYTCIHIETGREIKKSVWTSNYEGLLRIINKWNAGGKDWKYFAEVI